MIKRDKKLLTIEVNFGKQIMEILAEVQVLKKDFPDKIIPKPAEDVFTKYDSFRQGLFHILHAVSNNAITHSLS